jgi:hypothetical protein
MIVPSTTAAHVGWVGAIVVGMVQGRDGALFIFGASSTAADQCKKSVEH